MFDGQIHDGHSNHFEGQPRQAQPLTSNYQRALELNKQPIVYPNRVRVYTNAQVQGESHD